MTEKMTTPIISEQNSLSQTAGTDKNRSLFFGGAVLILIALATGFFLGKYLTQPKSTSPITQISPSPTPLSTSTSDPTINWKTYINDFGGFLLKYPEDFNYSEKSFSLKEKQVVFIGNAGKLTIGIASSDYSPGWGGGCDPENQKEITFLGKTKNACMNETGIWALYEQNPGKSQISISAEFNPPL